MKFLIPLLLLPTFLLAFQKTDSRQTPAPGKGGSVSLVCRLYNVSANIDSISLFEPLGLATKQVARGGRRASDSMYVFTLPASKARFYLLGQNESSVAKLILGEESEVTFYANIAFMHKGRTTGSKANKSYELMMKRIEQFRLESDDTHTAFVGSNGAEQQAAVTRINSLMQAKTKYLDSLKTANNLLWHVASLYLKPEYTGQKGYANEAEFISKQYFAAINFAGDRMYDDLPDITAAFESFHTALTQAGANQDEVKKYTDAMLAKLPAGSKTHRMALSGIINASKATNSQNYPLWARTYIDLYKTQDMGEINRLDFELKKSSTFTPGFEAPEIAGMTPDSGSFALSRLRGKVVLVDFWASWCGPCRKENPNVKANYAKYKEKGFEVLGVSLDREINAWRGAIKQDELTWNHISDLKGWQSQYANLYSVTSIPQTVLVGKDGRIIARNIRGEQLGMKLKEIFGE